MASNENTKGKHFEGKIAKLLMMLSDKHPDSIRIVRQPKLELNDGSVVIPDFEIQFTLVFEEGRYLVECQNRKRSRAEIAHKIRYIKNLSSRNRFIFVYGTNLPEATRASSMQTAW